MKQLSVVIALLLLLPLNAFAFFDDVDSSTPYQPEILWMQSSGIIQGYGDGNFGPDNCVTRAEFLKMLFNAFETSTVDYSHNFPDVQANSWYEPYVETALAQEVIEGYPDGTFKPNQCVNRVEATKMALEFAIASEIISASDYTPQFPDLMFDDSYRQAWYAPYLNTAFQKNFLGTAHLATSNFQPASDMSRKEVSVLLYRLATTVFTYELSYDENSGNLPLCYGQTISFTLFDGQLPLSFCVPQEFPNADSVSITTNGISPECYNGDTNFVALNNSDLHLSTYTKDFEKTCDSGVPNIDFSCFTESSTEEQLKACFMRSWVASDIDFNSIKKIKNLRGDTGYYFDYDYQLIGANEVTRHLSIYYPGDNYNFYLYTDNQAEKTALQQLFLTLQ